MFKSSNHKDTGAQRGEPKKSAVGKFFAHEKAGESSKRTGKSTAADTDYEIALRLQHTYDKESKQDLSSSLPSEHNLQSAKPSNNVDSPFPEDIQDAINKVQKFVAAIMKKWCYKCGSQLMCDFDIKKWFQDRLNLRGGPSFCAVSCPDSRCGGLTCLGCGQKPRIGKYMGKHKISGLVVDWCCGDGRLFAIWALLCRYDMTELKYQSQNMQQLETQTLLPHGLPAIRMPMDHDARSRLGGIPPNRGYGASSLNHSRFGGPPILNFIPADSKTDDATRKYLSLTIELLPDRAEKGKAAPPELSAMLELSLLQDRAAELLRNDSLQDTTSRAVLYFALFEFFERLGKHPDTKYLVYEKRFVKKQSSGLYAISMPTAIEPKGKGKANVAAGLILDNPKNMAAPLISCMGKLAKQSKVLVNTSHAAGKEFRTAEGEDVLEIANRVMKLYDSMVTDGSSVRDGLGGFESGRGTNSTWEKYHENHCMMTEDDILACLDSKLASNATELLQSPRNRIKRLVTEISEMSTSLPLNVFVKADTVRPDVMKCLIIGPEGTPYDGGLFEFDIFCPAAYPHVPPEVVFRTTAGGKIRFNPNMYHTGKVCLSLLGTWDGPPESKWQSGKSTILSVLVSIQALILCENPLTNEPSLNGALSTRKGRESSANYDREVQTWTVRFATIDWLRRSSMRDGVWKDVVRTYFDFHAVRVLAVARKWATQNRSIEGFDGWVKGLKVSRPMNLVRELEEALRLVCGDD